jgi:WD40 repeat protein
VLTARQMGKSSLMVRTAARLRQAGVAVVVLDFTAIGQNLSPEQWYDGLRDLLGQQLDLEDELEEFWQEQARLGPLQRWMKALREIVLARIPGRIVLFLDEIDAVRSLPFSTDEFFAAIRECYNRRTEEPEFQRLTFCLLGVASPSDLIRDVRTTPFNIGRRIELTDFSEAEAAPLAAGLGRKEPEGTRLLERVLYWTGGHPYLTQRLCRAVAEDAGMTDGTGVDRLCEALFLSPRARERDDNLLFVRERLLRSEADLASLIDLYGQIRRGKRVRDDETSPLVSLLRLSGVTRVVDGHLQVRNRIYERVFDREWITAHMPDADLRRQRAAYRQGLVRAAAVSGVILAVMAGLVWIASDQARRAGEGESKARRLLYVSDMGVAQRAWEDGNVGLMLDLLYAHWPQRGQREDPRSFEWGYLWRLCHSDLLTLRGHAAAVSSVAFSPDGRTLATGSEDTTVKLWNTATGQETHTLGGHSNAVTSVAFSPDGKTLATGSRDTTVKVWNAATGRESHTLTGHRDEVECVAFSRDGKILATVDSGNRVRLWEMATGRQTLTLTGHPDPLWSIDRLSSVAFSPDGRMLATGSSGGAVKFWNTATGREMRRLAGASGPLAFSPDGKRLATWCASEDDDTVKLWDTATGRQTLTLKRQAGGWFVSSLAFSPDGKLLATASADTAVELWNLTTGQQTGAFKGHTAAVNSVAFSPDGKSLATGSDDRTAKLWNATTGQEIPLLQPAGSRVAFSPNGKMLATGTIPIPGDREAGGTVQLWEALTGRRVRTFPGSIPFEGFAPDGTRLATEYWDGTMRLWDVATGRKTCTLRGAYEPAAFSPNGKWLATASNGFEIKLWDLATGQEIRRLKGQKSPTETGQIFSLKFSPDSKTLATGARLRSGNRKAVGTLQIWDVETGRVTQTHKGPHLGVWSVAFSPDGRLLATASQDTVVRVWDLATGRESRALRGHGSFVSRVAFSPDGKTLATGSAGGTVSLWSTTTWRQTLTLKGHRTWVDSVEFSPDGRTLASGGFDTVRLWQAGVQEDVAAREAKER